MNKQLILISALLCGTGLMANPEASSQEKTSPLTSMGRHLAGIHISGFNPVFRTLPKLTIEGEAQEALEQNQSFMAQCLALFELKTKTDDKGVTAIVLSSKGEPVLARIKSEITQETIDKMLQTFHEQLKGILSNIDNKNWDWIHANFADEQTVIEEKASRLRFSNRFIVSMICKMAKTNLQLAAEIANTAELINSKVEEIKNNANAILVNADHNQEQSSKYAEAGRAINALSRVINFQVLSNWQQTVLAALHAAAQRALPTTLQESGKFNGQADAIDKTMQILTILQALGYDVKNGLGTLSDLARRILLTTPRIELSTAAALTSQPATQRAALF